MDQSETSSKKKVLTALALLIVVFVIVGGLAMSKDNEKGETSEEGSTSTSHSAAPQTPAVSSTATFKDGTYKATASYGSPAGNQDITINVTLKDGKIADTSAVAGATDETAKDYQMQFIDGYKSQVVGKDIKSVNLTRVSGSSLTPNGFNDAIRQIEQQAKA